MKLKIENRAQNRDGEIFPRCNNCDHIFYNIKHKETIKYLQKLKDIAEDVEKVKNFFCFLKFYMMKIMEVIKQSILKMRQIN